MKNQLKVREILHNKLTLLQEFYRITLALQHALTEDETLLINDLINQRQKIIDQINGLDSEMALLEKHQHVEDNIEINNETEALKLQIRNCLQQTKKIDQEISSSFKEKLQEITTSLRSLRVSRQAQTLYIKKARQVQGFFVDKKK